MGRKSLSKMLNVWMNGELVGHWKISSSSEHSFQYTNDWINSPLFRPLSISMPVRPDNLSCTGPVVEAYFENLLPDSLEIRRRIQSHFGLVSSRAFDLLSEIGRDCVGAVQLLPEGLEPEGIGNILGDVLSAEAVESLLRNTTSTLPFQLTEDEFRISLAGAQEKNALLYYNGNWMKPRGTTPTTHIFKLPLGIVGGGQIDLRSSVENEWLCLRLLSGFGLDTPEAEILKFGTQKILAVKRFDRRFSAAGSWILRLPQEDFCQATGIPPGLKYESDGGPGIKRIMDILLGSSRAFPDRRIFMKAQFLFWLLGAVDGHAKNFSIFLERGGNFRLTPFYDVLSIYPVIGKRMGQLSVEKVRMAMAVTGEKRHYKWKQIYRRHWLSTAAFCGFPEEEMNEIIDEVVSLTPEVILKTESDLPSDFPIETADSIFENIKSAVNRIT